MRTLAILVTSAVFAAAAAPAAMASQASPGNPSGTGMPSQTCENNESANLLPSVGAANSPGAVFNESDLPTPSGGTSSGGKGGAQYNLVGAPSQYDVACFQTQFKVN